LNSKNFFTWPTLFFFFLKKVATIGGFAVQVKQDLSWLDLRLGASDGGSEPCVANIAGSSCWAKNTACPEWRLQAINLAVLAVNMANMAIKTHEICIFHFFGQCGTSVPPYMHLFNGGLPVAQIA